MMRQNFHSHSIHSTEDQWNGFCVIIPLYLAASLVGHAVRLGLHPGFRILAQYDLLARYDITAPSIVILSLFVAAFIILTDITGRVSHHRAELGVALCLLIGALLSMLPHAIPELGSRYLMARYPKWLYLAASYGVPPFLLLTTECTDCYRFLRNRWSHVVPALHLGTAGFALTLVSECSTSGMTWSGFMRIDDKSTPVFLINVLLATSLLAAIYALSNHLWLSIILGGTLHSTATMANILKLQYLQEPLALPADLYKLTELIPYAHGLFSIPATLVSLTGGTALCLGLYFLWSQTAHKLSVTQRVVLGLVSVTMFVVPPLTYHYDPSRSILSSLGVRLLHWDKKRSSRRNGFLLEQILRSAIPYTAPDTYSRAEVARIANQYSDFKHTADEVEPPNPPINLVILIVESLMDPHRFGVPFSQNPIPHLTRLKEESSSGYAFVPTFGTGSGNTEFEIVTGLSMAFLTNSDIGYSWVKQDIPSLPRLLNEYGYRTAAIQADPPSFYSRWKAYPHIGFTSYRFLRGDDGMDFDLTGPTSSDDVLIDEIIEESTKGSPFFILGFTDGSHFPYTHSRYQGSDLTVLGKIRGEPRLEVHNYINALKEADQAIGKLIQHFKRTRQKTIVVILGDHLPPFRGPDGVYEQTGCLQDSSLRGIPIRLRVPILVWANFERPRQHLYCSTNFLAVELLQMLGIPPKGFLKINAGFHRRFRVISQFVETDGGDAWLLGKSVESRCRAIRDYHVIQHDLLQGNQFLKALQSGGDPVPAHD